MTHADTDQHVGLVELNRTECLRLLGQGVIGRIVYTTGALPAVLPVNYAMDGDEIIFRTGSDTIMEAATSNEVVAFEVDDVNPETRTGWSVVALGKAYHVTDADRLTELTTRVPPPWAPGRSANTIAVPTLLLTGRQLREIKRQDA